MAFQQSARHVTQRVARPSAAQEQQGHAAAYSERQSLESHSWILFSAPTDAATASYLRETDNSLLTPGRSLLSDIGSLNTVARSVQAIDAQAPSQSAVDDDSVEDDAELDSLDSHLPEFRSLPGAQNPSQNGGEHSLPVLPAHDGLGSFHLANQPVLGRDAQDRIYQLERFNPRIVRRRLDSFHRAQLDMEHSQHQEQEKRMRIEAWRLDHSAMLLDQVERETRRRRKSRASMQHVSRPIDTESDNMTWHDEDHIRPEAENEGKLASITRTVVRDLLGVEDRVLSLLLGESMTDNTYTTEASQLGSESPYSRLHDQARQSRLLDTLSRELGVLVSRLSHHPGAFSTFKRTQQLPFSHAGLPIIPEAEGAPRLDELAERKRLSAPGFRPTMQQAAQPPMVPGATPDMGDQLKKAAKPDNTFTQEEWEKDLDVKLVFKYLMSRFSGLPETSSAGGSRGASSLAQDGSVNISRVRQHHPLIARSRPAERRVLKATVATHAVTLRHPSSCASQSTRLSTRRSSCSSRHFWDIGGSMGTGSVVASHGPMGSWGEV